MSPDESVTSSARDRTSRDRTTEDRTSKDRASGNRTTEDHSAQDHHQAVVTPAPLIVTVGLAFLFIGLSVAHNEGHWSYWVLTLLGLTTFLWGVRLWAGECLPRQAEDLYPSEHEPFSNVTPRKLGTWIFLLTEAMVFGTLFTSYIRLRLASDDWISSAALIQESVGSFAPGVINSLLMIVSSLTMVLALQAIKRNDQERMVRMMTLTLVLGTAFIIIKGFEWYELVHEHDFWLDTSISGSIFYITTGTHGAHVLAGLVVLGFMVLKGKQGGYTRDNHNTLEYFGLYWHLIDLLWLFVFAAFYLI